MGKDLHRAVGKVSDIPIDPEPPGMGAGEIPETNHLDASEYMKPYQSLHTLLLIPCDHHSMGDGREWIVQVKGIRSKIGCDPLWC